MTEPSPGTIFKIDAGDEMKKRTVPKLREFNDPILRKRCSRVKPDEDISSIIKDMRYLLTNSKNGVGLAAPQAGYLKRVILVHNQVMINPRIIRRSWKKAVGVEGCLSYPKMYKEIKRSTRIKVKYISEHGTICSVWFEAIWARIIQHEIDHLNGKCKVKS